MVPHPYYPEMFVRVNGGVSRISSRPYAPCYYYVASEIQRENSNFRKNNRVSETFHVEPLPDYRAVVRDTEGRQFKFVNRPPPPSYRESC